ncbi:hypothetical protein NDU88_004839 [Pleurodeles waltl]|uniref:Uncharacterized protein n=1 Tax=Pleurodeles waltl TaxID=8319 RepID=A0AAV7WVI0_PLEWA|nr:hypothetical protein NDU88_004839 [Pleurodeles waltl]
MARDSGGHRGLLVSGGAEEFDVVWGSQPMPGCTVPDPLLPWPPATSSAVDDPGDTYLSSDRKLLAVMDPV